MRNEVERRLNKVREGIRRDGGDVELVNVDETNGVVTVNPPLSLQQTLSS